jgi:hypothetical protein
MKALFDQMAASPPFGWIAGALVSPAPSASAYLDYKLYLLAPTGQYFELRSLSPTPFQLGVIHYSYNWTTTIILQSDQANSPAVCQTENATVSLEFKITQTLLESKFVIWVAGYNNNVGSDFFVNYGVRLWWGEFYTDPGYQDPWSKAWIAEPLASSLYKPYTSQDAPSLVYLTRLTGLSVCRLSNGGYFIDSFKGLSNGVYKASISRLYLLSARGATYEAFLHLGNIYVINNKRHLLLRTTTTGSDLILVDIDS